LKRGLIHVYTGDGKGKTTAAVGLTVRAAGNGLKCCFIQFLKGWPTGEKEVLEKLPTVTFIQTGRRDYNFKPTEIDKELVKKGFEKAKEISNSYDLIVLDEINVAVFLKLLEPKEVLEFLKNKPKNLELVLTGRHAHPEVVKIADYVTYFEMIKHPYYKHLKARKGIDY